MGSELNLVLIGAPGAGKGTQAKRLEAKFAIPLLSTGEILRASIRTNSPTGLAAKKYMDVGDLVPDDLIIAVAAEHLAGADTAKGFILDGFPRTSNQAGALEEELVARGRRVTHVLLIDVPDAEIVKRIAGRRVCVEKGHGYHVEYDPPARVGICDHDGSPLTQRDDDKPDVVNSRLSVYREQTAPVVEYYRERRLLNVIDGVGSPSEVGRRVDAALTDGVS